MAACAMAPARAMGQGGPPVARTQSIQMLFQSMTTSALAADAQLPHRTASQANVRRDIRVSLGGPAEHSSARRAGLGQDEADILALLRSGRQARRQRRDRPGRPRIRTDRLECARASTSSTGWCRLVGAATPIEGGT